ncbi:MAG: CDP-diacylglycerol--serine O-phosphatidyltransferase [Cyclobacteriaceae bacterium]|nr:CDP-diacylglycerol--serine O-phosphatidyltransferase [Cyclobacteriaceae bacterium]MCH8515526.1 CDP-diacylglycerol--serine O-phosphatidyltransferase [Cyclobacteriaceae bacterium]
MKKYIPNFLTSCNLFTGCLAVVFVFEGRADLAPLMVLIAAGFDFLDGFAARLLKVSSPEGKELDSLADVVSFGFLPAVVMYDLIGAQAPEGILKYAAFVIAVFSALRLAKFNVDEGQEDRFIGLPTPANAIFIVGLALFSQLHPSLGVVLESNNLVVITFVFSVLLVAPLPLIALKFKSMAFGDNLFRYILLLGSVLILLIFQAKGLSLIVLFYLLLSVVENIVNTTSSKA